MSDTTETIPFAWSGIDAVVFDIGGVIAIPHHNAVRSQLQSHGLAAPAPDLAYHRAHFAAMWAIHDEHPEPAQDVDPATWRSFDVGYLRALGFAVGGDQPPAGALAEILDSGGVKRDWTWVLVDAVAAIHRLDGAGVPIAIVSNNDGTADQQMVDFGVGQVGAGPGVDLAAIVDSGAIGIAKPDPRIFQPALDALAVEPSRVLYVGDTVHADVRGATAAGMPVVQVDPYGFHAALNHQTAPSVPSIVDALLGG